MVDNAYQGQTQAIERSKTKKTVHHLIILGVLTLVGLGLVVLSYSFM